MTITRKAVNLVEYGLSSAIAAGIGYCLDQNPSPNLAQAVIVSSSLSTLVGVGHFLFLKRLKHEETAELERRTTRSEFGDFQVKAYGDDLKRNYALERMIIRSSKRAAVSGLLALTGYFAGYLARNLI